MLPKCAHNTSSKKSKTSSLLKSLDHATDHLGRSAIRVLLEPCNEGVEGKGLLTVVGGLDSGRLRCSWCSCRRRRSSISGAGGVGATLTLDALGVVWVPLLACEAGGA